MIKFLTAKVSLKHHSKFARDVKDARLEASNALAVCVHFLMKNKNWVILIFGIRNIYNRS